MHPSITWTGGTPPNDAHTSRTTARVGDAVASAEAFSVGGGELGTAVVETTV